MRIWFAPWAAFAVALAGCATNIAPSDLWESQDEPWQRDTTYGRVTAVQVESTPNPHFPDSSRMPHMAMYGALGMLFADTMSSAMADKSYTHTIQTPEGQVLTKTSSFQFPVGTCVSTGANNTKYPGGLARSKRCEPR